MQKLDFSFFKTSNVEVPIDPVDPKITIFFFSFKLLQSILENLQLLK